MINVKSENLLRGSLVLITNSFDDFTVYRKKKIKIYYKLNRLLKTLLI